MDENTRNDAEEKNAGLTQNENGSEITEGEIVESSATGTSDQAQTILESLEGMIRQNLAKISKLGEELKQQKEMLASVLDNDETYKQHQDAVKAATKIRNGTKNEILKRLDVAQVNERVKGLTAEIKESKESLNSYLPEYQRLSGSNEINNENGEPMEIVFVEKLVKRRP